MKLLQQRSPVRFEFEYLFPVQQQDDLLNVLPGAGTEARAPGLSQLPLAHAPTDGANSVIGAVRLRGCMEGPFCRNGVQQQRGRRGQWAGASGRDLCSEV